MKKNSRQWTCWAWSRTGWWPVITADPVRVRRACLRLRAWVLLQEAMGQRVGPWAVATTGLPPRYGAEGWQTH